MASEFDSECRYALTRCSASSNPWMNGMADGSQTAVKAGNFFVATFRFSANLFPPRLPIILRLAVADSSPVIGCDCTVRLFFSFF